MLVWSTPDTSSWSEAGPPDVALTDLPLLAEADVAWARSSLTTYVPPLSVSPPAPTVSVPTVSVAVAPVPAVMVPPRSA